MLHLSLILPLLFLASLLSFLSSMLLILGLNTSRLCAPYHMIYPRCPTIWEEKHLSTQPLGGCSALECYSPIVHRNTHVDNATLRSEEEESSRSLSHPCGTSCTEIDHSPFSPLARLAGLWLSCLYASGITTFHIAHILPSSIASATKRF